MSVDPLREVQRAVECPVCLEPFHTTNTPTKSGDARALACSHLICGACLRRLQPDAAGRLGCPICRTPIITRTHPIVKEAAFVAENMAIIDERHRESEGALRDKIRELEQKLSSAAGAAPSAAAVKQSGPAPPTAPPTAAPNPAAAPTAVHSVVAEMKGFTQINGSMYVEIVYVGNPKVHYVPLASAPPCKMLESLVKREYNKNKPYFTKKVREQFEKGLGYDVIAIGKS